MFKYIENLYVCVCVPGNSNVQNDIIDWRECDRFLSHLLRSLFQQRLTIALRLGSVVGGTANIRREYTDDKLKRTAHPRWCRKDLRCVDFSRAGDENSLRDDRSEITGTKWIILDSAVRLYNDTTLCSRCLNAMCRTLLPRERLKSWRLMKKLKIIDSRGENIDRPRYKVRITYARPGR